MAQLGLLIIGGMPDATGPAIAGAAASTGTTRTACSYCGVGCGITVRTELDAAGAPVIAKVSGDKLHPSNAGRLCTKGATHAELMRGTGRMGSAYRRAERGSPPLPIPVDAAVHEVAERLRAILDAHGPDAIALYVSGQMSLEAQYLATKLAKGFLRTKHIEANSRLCMASAGTGYKQSLGADGPPGSYRDFEHADLFLVIGANMADCHPILFLRMADRLKAGAKLIVVDPRRTDTAAKADLFLQISPGTDLALLNGLLHLLVANGDIDERFIAEHTEGWAAMPEFLADYAPAAVAETTGIAETDLRTAAQWIGAADAWMSLWTMGLNQSTHGTWHTNALCNLHLATGAICRPGTGPFSLTGQPNAMGGREMGYMGPGLPGQRSVLNAGDRAFVEAEWGLSPGTLRAESGPGTIEMFHELARGEIKAAWIICTNPVATVSNRKTVIAGLERAELVVAQDAYTDTATNAYADILLPATLWAESDAVMVNSERTVTLLNQSIPPHAAARPDWLLIAQVATAMGFSGFDYLDSAEVFDEITRFANPATGYDLRGMDYRRLREGPMQWPCADPEQPRNPIRYRNDGVSQPLFVDDSGRQPELAFATPSRRAVFWPRPQLPPAELPDDDFPFLLNTGRLQHQWHTMTKTGKVAKLNKLTGSAFVEVHPEDAQRLGVRDGEQLEVASRRGRAVLAVRVADRVRRGDCFVPFHWNDEQGEYLTINAVTNDAVDPDSLQPEFKQCAVALRKVAAVPKPAARAEGHPLAATLGLSSGPPEFGEVERSYLSGFLAALHELPANGLPALPDAAPFAQAHRRWIDGWLAGMYSHAEVSETPPAVERTAANSATTTVTVLWSSQTGNAEELATATSSRLTAEGFVAKTVAMDDCALIELAGDVVLITSTFGDGGAPDNGSDFWERLGASTIRLTTVRFAVLALGDSSYDDFCGHGRRLDELLEERGARRLLRRVDCEPDFDDEAAAWLGELVATLRTGTGSGAADSASDIHASKGTGAADTNAGAAETNHTGTPRGAIERRNVGATRQANTTGVRTLPAAPDSPARFTRKAPVLTRMLRNEPLTQQGSTKEVRRIGFAIDPTLRYEVGDSLGVLPTNSPDAVAAWLAATGLSGERGIELDGREVPLREALRTGYEITKVAPGLLRFLAERNGDDRLAKLLRRDNQHELDAYRWDRTAADVIEDFPVRADPIDWLGILKRLQPRQYSISSSPLLCPDEVELTVGVVRYGDRASYRGGVCSTFLADRVTEQPVPIFRQPAPHFRPPTDADADAPMIMVGAGTGIAPFRGFLQHRQALGSTGRNWLLFGDQHAAQHFYYRTELEDMFRSGFLTRLDLAFSRDQRERIYVQHRMVEHGAQLWSWLREGAHLYVCGDAARMAKDVDEALLGIARRHGKLDEAGALAFKKQLTAEKRYLRDVY